MKKVNNRKIGSDNNGISISINIISNVITVIIIIVVTYNYL